MQCEFVYRGASRELQRLKEQTLLSLKWELWCRTQNYSLKYYCRNENEIDLASNKARFYRMDRPHRLTSVKALFLFVDGPRIMASVNPLSA